ncbi:hypothetical protein CE11_00115 [Megavirus courdo11]|uniref:Uncharacterized protein n=3 Tax=Megavirus chilense TaxID=3060301 RepID=L7XX20_9VIRU|nr:hypothetical protein MegaChil _gp0120 [Megavirus chiliensis]AFX92147.1 hypothetical protein CE11_00115 [Megavirus courdo11]AGD92015.1 hypothetical protein LBA_00093 [Megavirus lba]
MHILDHLEDSDKMSFMTTYKEYYDLRIHMTLLKIYLLQVDLTGSFIEVKYHL